MATAKPAAMASIPRERWLVPFTRFWRNRSWARCSNVLISTSCRYRARRVPRAISGGGAPWTSVVVSPTLSPVRPQHTGSGSVLVGHHQLFGGEQREQLRPVRGDHDLLLDPRGRVSVIRRAVRLEREHHPLLELDGMPERVQAAEDG